MNPTHVAWYAMFGPKAGQKLVALAREVDRVALVNELAEANAKLKAVTEALGNYPECDLHADEDDPIKCGWLGAVVEARRALRKGGS